jgi:hypothetical protein
MRHVSDGVLRRLLDEPLAVADAARHHLAACGRCRASSGEIAENAARAFRALSVPQLATDSGLAWTQLQQRLAGPPENRIATFRPPRLPSRRVVNASIGTGAAVAAGVLVAGVAAAATLTTVFAPTKVASVPVSRSDLRAVSSILDLGTSQVTGDAAPATGSQQLPFGTLRWNSAGPARHAASLARARAITQLPYAPPKTLPAGVGSVRAIIVQPAVTATVRFSRSAGPAVGGGSLVVTGGPAMLVQYRNVAGGGARVPTLAILTMRRPVVSSTGTTTSQLEAFLLSRPGVPAGLAREIRLLGNLRTVLPVPVPAGVAEGHVRIGGSPGILVSDSSGAVSGVIWESRGGIVHAVAGLLDKKDVLNVARQLG